MKQFAALALVAMKQTNQGRLVQLKLYQHTNANGLPFYLANAVFDKETNQWQEIQKLQNHTNPEIWQQWLKLSANEMGMLWNGVGGQIKDPQNDMKCILPTAKPINKKVTYAQWVADFLPQKDDPYRTQIMCIGNGVQYNGETSTDTAGVETIQIHANHVISSPDAKFCVANMSDF